MRKAWYYSAEPNFGDLLNRYILPLLNPSIDFASRNECDLVAIGSILQTFAARKTLLQKVRKAFLKPLHVWGSGFLADCTEHGTMFRRPMVFYALRGKLTKALCGKLLGYELGNVCLGDPGLLAWKLVKELPAEPVFDVGIVPHYVDGGNDLLNRIQLSRYSSVILDVMGEPLDVLAKLASCRVILSSAMHGLIVADSLGIPNAWISFDSHDLRHKYFKFHDYYSVLGITPEPVRLGQTIINDDLIEHTVEKYAVPREKILSICNDLEEVFPAGQQAWR